MHYRFRHSLQGGHRHVAVFIGHDDDHLQKSGDLVFTDDHHRDEWTPFRLAMQAGARYTTTSNERGTTGAPGSSGAMYTVSFIEEPD